MSERNRPGQRTRAMTRLGETMARSVLNGDHDDARRQAAEYKKLADELRREDEARQAREGYSKNRIWDR